MPPFLNTGNFNGGALKRRKVKASDIVRAPRQIFNFKTRITMQIIYTYPQLGQRFKNAVKSLLSGVLGLMWATILLLANSAVRGYKKLIAAIRAYPCVATAATFLLMLVVAIAIHMQMKVKLTTAEWQRDSLQQRLDSAKVGRTLTYYKYQNYD